MLEEFRRVFIESSSPGGAATDLKQVHILDVPDILIQLGGRSYNNGLYRVIRFSDIEEWNARITFAFPDFKDRIVCFAFDWLGRVFATDSERMEGGRPGVIMFEAGTGEALEIPCNIVSFHDDELINYADAALAEKSYQRWLQRGGAAPGYGQCVGCKMPLFLGGVDDLENMHVCDIDVYWHLLGQIIARTKNLPTGARVNINLLPD